MLDGNNHISRIEHRLVLVLASLVCFVRVGQLIQLLIATFFPEPPPPGVRISYGLVYIFDDPAFVGPMHTFFVFACVAMLWKLTKGRLIIAASFLALPAWFFDSWFLYSQRIIDLSARSEGGLIDHNPVLVGGTYFDVFTLVAVNVLLIWIVFTAVKIIMALRKIP